MTVDSVIERDCVIAGGGPAGMVLGYLLARRGLRVTVLEKHGDFLRDFRGDTVHPSTVTLLGELGLRHKFLELPLTRLSTLDAVVDGQRLTIVDFGTLPLPDNFLVLAPQWDFLNFLARETAAFPTFELRLRTEATHLIIDGGQVRGVRARTSDGGLEIRAPLTVAADGRSSDLRAAAGLAPDNFGVPIDVLWFNLPKPPDPPPPTLGYISAQGLVLTINRGDRYQSGMAIRKGGFDGLRAGGIDALQAKIASAAPFLRPVVGTLTDWDQVKLLSVQINRLRRWYRPGFIAIGDAAHAMSPMFGVGVNFAVQDAVALANAIAEDLAMGKAPTEKLAAVQRRREMPVKIVQQVQRNGHRVLLRATSGNRIAPRWFVMFLRAASPLLRPVTARFVGIGIRPEHVRSGST
ncbi:2-polyprenyl-6-methoxyphenol hydroxylase [Arthrobacter sp. 9AX]|uniref:FAD-dependent oxidoreductase n=1 Tax=Arthrobacter sp. 9AX TaxID=2653131 RepID=UPI0012F02A25|nr:FAD-dependent oxidoreductase [Arthrobacter sp. 9AX]VXB97470.1 2-polyprenyl-6-methoxyphenol hydroxylase [Arthrobacter sp. 9AX]